MATDTPGFVITQEIIDEFLEAQWLLDEQGKNHAIKRSALPAIVIDEGVIEDAQKAAMVIEKMAKDGYISISGEDIAFTDRGRETAKNLTRRKRLAEKLLAEVLALGPSEIKSSACRFEHILSPEVTDSVCAFLGHPPTCPHGKPIPHGDCCKKLTHHMRPLVMPMKDIEPGSRARIVFIAPKDHSRMDRLSSLGIVPGTEILLHQKKPAFVIRAGETELALDIEIAGEIYVKVLN
jgi:DtxR family Mn-dependent transcriptional regulator